VLSILRSFADELGGALARILAYLCGIAALVVAAAQLAATPWSIAAVEPAAPPDWIDVGRPHPAFAIRKVDPHEAEPRYAIRRHSQGGGRKDIMSWGEPIAPAGMVEIYRPGPELDGFADVATEIVARAGALGALGPMTAGDPLDTKLGPVAVVDFTAAPASEPRRCVGFARTFEDPRLQIAGWHCKGGPELIDRGALACALDRLTLLMAASEPKVTEFFANAELKRKFCGQKPVPRATYTQRHDWIDASKEPKLRGRVAGR